MGSPLYVAFLCEFIGMKSRTAQCRSAHERNDARDIRVDVTRTKNELQYLIDVLGDAQRAQHLLRRDGL
ncbi:hypothetical protein BCh11DRAFT_04264 [Burkholderia sp. Ch1-1]|nr:hypothetical protein BCh11DRAFT_04264 [Burkholderia sp. Ch1-1]